MIKFIFFVLLFLFFFSTSHAAEDFHVIPLHYRTADEMAPILKSMFAGRARFSQLDTRLVVACEDDTYKQVLHLLASLDRKPHQLMISAKVARKEEMSKTKINVAAAANQEKQNLSIQAQHLQARSVENGARSLIVVEGFRANFHTAELYPAMAFSGQQGFSVLAQLAQDNSVNIEFTAHDDKNLQATSLTTSLHGELDKWIAAGAISQSQAGASSTDSQMMLWLKVSLAD